jgi:hypothetical protein
MEKPGNKNEGNGNPAAIGKIDVAKEAPSGKRTIQFIFTHNGRTLNGENTPEDAGMEDQDEILAVELMDLTENGEGVEEWVRETESMLSTCKNQENKRRISLSLG